MSLALISLVIKHIIPCQHMQYILSSHTIDYVNGDNMSCPYMQ